MSGNTSTQLASRTRSVEMLEAHIEKLEKQLNRAEAKKSELDRKVTMVTGVIDNLKDEIARYEAEADEKADKVRLLFERADRVAAREIGKAERGAQVIAPSQPRDREKQIEGQRMATHRRWHISGQSTPKKECEYCVQQGLYVEPEATATKAPSTKKKRSDVRKGLDVADQGRYGMHTRWHVDRELFNDNCEYCREEGNK